MNNKKKYGLFILICTIFGSTFLVISLGLNAGASPLFFASLRFILAGGTMLPILLLTRKTDFHQIKKLLGRSAFLSLFLTSGTFGCMFIAQTGVDSGFMARLDATGPLFTALFSALFFRKALSTPHFAAFILGMAGSFLIASPASTAEPFYLLMAGGSVILYAVGNALYPALFRQNEDPIVISALQSLSGGLILFAAALLTEKIHLPLNAFGPLVYLVIIGSIIGHTASLILVKEAGPVFASGWLYVAPVVASVLGILVLGEILTVNGITGTLIALAGVFILDRAEKLPKKKKKNC